MCENAPFLRASHAPVCVSSPTLEATLVSDPGCFGMHRPNDRSVVLPFGTCCIALRCVYID